MKRMDLFCASPAATAICTAIDHRAMVRRGHKPIERQYYSTCSSELLPLTPRPYNNNKSRKSTSSSDCNLRRKSSANVDELKKSLSSGYLLSRDHEHKPFINDRWIDAPDHSHDDRTVDSVSLAPNPALKKTTVLARLNKESPLFNSTSSTRSGNNSPALVLSLSGSNSPAAALPVFNISSSSSSHKSHQNQVVVLRVSIHCKGCEGKLRKHISKMKGVTSFEIDLKTKKVTVIGNITPLSVLQSVSQVKTAQLWPCSSSPDLPSKLIN